MDIIGKRFSPVEFAVYAKAIIPPAKWKGEFIVLHNTSEPTLAERPHGFLPEHMVNLADYYSGLGWSHGPHLFVDDNGIWVFSPLSAPGIHSPSWNAISYGVEQLGEFDTEAYETGRGLAVQKNAIAAMAVIGHFAGIDSHSMRLHKEDPNTTHRDCPGGNCASHKAAIMDAVHAYMVAHLLPPAHAQGGKL